MASSSSSGGRWRYDVFLNFRREDTRKIFIGHLYKALDQKAINTFIDADNPELLTTIEESKLSIVVFSKNYASSTRCLKQLVHILDCMDTKKHMVVPIFYQVDPSDVRKLAGCFAEAFAQHDHDSNANMEEVSSWRSALTKATNLTGWDSRGYRDDAKFIEEIVQDIFSKLIHFSSSSSGGRWKYDVFISFRGEDTRKSFVGHLYKALCQNVVSTFSDVETFSKGNDLSDLLKAIQESRILIVVFSENYASSTWCLRELVEIMKCVETNNQMVIPVFYGVDPSDVRRVAGPFGEAFARYEHISSIHMEEVTRWRSALTRAANYSGIVRNSCKDDAKLIEDIVQHTWRTCRGLRR